MFSPDKILKEFTLNNGTLESLLKKMEKELENGLDKALNTNAEIKQLPTYVTATPNGSERGNFLALDLGGTNFRILLVNLDEDKDHPIKIDQQSYFVPKSIMTGNGTDLFDYLANNLFDFLKSRDMMCMLLPIGFTFSFPTVNLSMTKTILTSWSKGYTATGVVGEDIGKLLNEAINRRFRFRCQNFDLRIMSTVVNDTVGTMQASAHTNNNTSMGMIVGTGTNMCYMEKIENIGTIDPASVELQGEMCINTEWGTFGDVSGALDDVITEFDREIDLNSPNVGEHKYEKMFGGMYLGEIARRVIIKLSEENVLFQQMKSESVLHQAGLSTAFVSQLCSCVPHCR